MQDILQQLIAIASTKNAVILLIAVIALVVFGRDGSLLIERYGTPPVAPSVVLFVVFYCASRIMVSLLSKLWSVQGSLWDSLKAAYNRRNSRNEFRGRVKSTIPQLPDEQISLLLSLVPNEKMLDVTDAFHLEMQSFIKKVHFVSSSRAVFALDPIVKEELCFHVKEQRKRKLLEFLQGINSHEEEFLLMYFTEEITEGTCGSGKLMKNSTYNSVDHMVNMKVLQRVGETAFRLEPDVVETLERLFDKKCVRQELRLDEKFIAGTGASGSGTRSSIR